ncbi:grpE protein homolog 1, mitochondrial-like [Babylonia areolata]|uniref:grpE protein homolog 1, mitochondrial-like n=1 Tax=Babylonia areolata TaxID=304850 RepID=UPI003FD4E89D
MAASGNMCLRTLFGISRATRSYVNIRMNRRELLRLSSTATNGKTEAADSAATDAAKEELSAAEKALTEEKNKLQEDLKEIKDKYMRSLAETENVRQRMKKQVDEAKLYGIQGFCKDMLEVADILNTATHSVPQDQLSSSPHLKNLFEGLTMTETQLQKVFGKFGLVKVSPAEGEKFDPNIHEALFQVPTTDKEGGTVAVVQKIGYKLHDRTLRPALVGVFKAS